MQHTYACLKTHQKILQDGHYCVVQNTLGFTAIFSQTITYVFPISITLKMVFWLIFSAIYFLILLSYKILLYGQPFKNKRQLFYHFSSSSSFFLTKYCYWQEVNRHQISPSIHPQIQDSSY